jgi:hypothetical protein
MAGKKESSEATVQTIRWVTRQKYPTEERARIVLDGLRGETSIAVLGPNPYGVCSFSDAWKTKALDRLPGPAICNHAVSSRVQSFCDSPHG